MEVQASGVVASPVGIRKDAPGVGTPGRTARAYPRDGCVVPEVLVVCAESQP